MNYLLDANAVSRLLAGNRAISRNLRYRPETTVGISAIVMFELTFGALKGVKVNDNLALLAQIRLGIVPFELADAQSAAQVRLSLNVAGKPIGPYDTLIAGQALARDLTLITHNTGEFSRVPGLRLEDWET